MRKFWVLYSVLPVLLLTVFLGGNFASEIAAAPGEPASTKLVQFQTASEMPNPNETLSLVNQQRITYGLESLIADEKLGKLAQARADDMAQKQYYAHKDPDGRYYYNYFDQFEIQTGYNCENLDLVFVPDQELVIKEWMASLRGHRACMMNQKTTHAGYATSKITLVDFEGKETTAYVVVAIHATLYK